MPIKKIIILLIAIPGLLKANAQTWANKTFLLQEDNSPFAIQVLSKGSNGYIYAGTTNGLYVFDGTLFKKINFSNTAVKDTITAIFEDNNKQLWAGCKSGRIAKKINGHLEYFEPEEGTSKVSITAFLQDKQNNIWFATNGEGVYYFNNNHLYLINEAEGLSDKYVHALALADNGDVLAATDQGINICRITGAKKTVEVIGPKNGLPDYFITAIAPAGNNNFWIGMQEKGICLYNHTTHQITIPPAVNNWNYGQVNSLLLAPSNKLWIATEEKGLLQLPGINQKIKNADVATGNINNLIQDSEGNLWMRSGASLISTSADKLQLLPLYDKTTFETIHTIMSDYENNIWAGTEGGLIKYIWEGGERNKKNYRIKELTSKTDITGLYQDAYHNIWISTMGEGIFVMDPVNGRYRNINENLLLKKASVLSVTGNGKSICAGGLEGVATIFELTDANKTIDAQYNYINYNNIPNIGNNYIHTVYKDNLARIWFATDGRGITVLQNGEYTHFDKSTGLKDNIIYSFAEDIKGNIWFNTKDAGIYCYNGKMFTNYGTAQGLSSLKISALKTDRQGNVVIVNERGIDILQPANGTVSYLDNTQGITGLNTDMQGITTDTAKNILLSTVDGILVYSPVANSIQQPKTIIDNILLFLKPVDSINSHLFNYDENSFTFNFTGLYYTNPGKVRYQYKLQGWDSSWVETKDQSIPFPNLRPGKYTFHVRSSINDNFSNANEVSYSFTIKTPFWKRLWFILLSILSGLALVFWYFKYREKHYKKIQQLQQEKIQFQLQVLGSQVNPHFLFNSFNTLISAIEDNPKTAVGYVEKMSDFFRNIVNYRDRDIITLGEEINLLNTYFYLQQKRYGNNLKLNINIPDAAKEQCLIPPLTLQLLTENAVKHNAVSKEAPLTVDLYFENENQLVLRNNINPKISPQDGTGMGLQNIVSRYKLLSKAPVIITNNTNYFTVSLPALKKIT
jgi:streptogramin lyase